MERIELNELINGVLEKRTAVDYDQIPDIELYMDQMTTFINDRLSGYKRNKDDKLLTKTMINNYTKDNMLPPPKKKKYNKEQAALLMIIYHFKSEVTINDISAIFDYMESQAISVESLYRFFVGCMEQEINNFGGNVNDIIDKADEITKKHTSKVASDKTLILAVITSLIVEANSRKLLAERLIDCLKTM